jgi:hypothetical protein
MNEEKIFETLLFCDVMSDSDVHFDSAPAQTQKQSRHCSGEKHYAKDHHISDSANSITSSMKQIHLDFCPIF